MKSILANFFFLQYKAALFPGKIPRSSVDHPLDRAIPFSPRWVTVYLDFVAFWVRSIGFLLGQFRRQGIAPVQDFLDSMGSIYTVAAQVYHKRLSTTQRPRYLARPRFFLIHLADPHLMCIPSLHVMVVIRTYTAFREILRRLGADKEWAPQIEEIRQGALRITEAILYVKQHSVNCIPAALYAMTRFESALFPPDEAVRFTAELFSAPGSPPEREAILNHIQGLYEHFLTAGRDASSWEEPLLDFLEQYQAPGRQGSHTM